MQKRSVIISVAVVVLGVASIGFAQFRSQANQRELGYYDRSTGAFEPAKTTMDPEAAAAVVPRTGTLIVKLTITVDSVIPKNAVVGCSTDADVSDDSSGFTSEEHASTVATLVSGKTYSCTMTIPYSWTLASPTTDKIGISYTTNIGYGYQVTATNGTAVLVQPVTARSVIQPVGSIAVPANGATTTETISVTM
jgi:hypothetical protein